MENHYQQAQLYVDVEVIDYLVTGDPISGIKVTKNEVSFKIIEGIH